MQILDVCVNTFMSAKMARFREGLGTDLALIRSFSGVISHMCSQHARGGEILFTQFTLKRPLSCMRTLVNLDSASCGEALVTELTTKRPLPSVHSLVFFDVTQGGERLDAVLTLEAVVGVVSSLVLAKVTRIRQHHGAQLALHRTAGRTPALPSAFAGGRMGRAEATMRLRLGGGLWRRRHMHLLLAAPFPRSNRCGLLRASLLKRSKKGCGFRPNLKSNSTVIRILRYPTFVHADTQPDSEV